jgi:hypothetical protein
MWIKRGELEAVLAAAIRPYLENVSEIRDLCARLEERMNYAERIARLEARLEEIERRRGDSRE